MSEEITVHEVEAQTIAAVRARMRIAEVPQRFGPLLDKVWSVIRAGDAQKHRHNVFVYRVRDDSDEADVEIGVQVPHVSPARTRSSVQTLPPAEWPTPFTTASTMNFLVSIKRSSVGVPSRAWSGPASTGRSTVIGRRTPPSDARTCSTCSRLRARVERIRLRPGVAD